MNERDILTPPATAQPQATVTELPATAQPQASRVQAQAQPQQVLGAKRVPAQAEIQQVLAARHSQPVQDRLNAAQVSIAGLGGLGSNIAVSLARIGVGHLHLIDFDCVDMTNLNRQHYFIRHLGMPKTEALAEILREINPYLDVKVQQVKVTEENLCELFKDSEIVCEAFDVPECKAMLVNGILENYPEKILVAASGMAGYGASNAIRTRRVMKNFYLCGDEVSGISEGHGLMAPRVAICAAHEANLITELIIDGQAKL